MQKWDKRKVPWIFSIDTVLILNLTLSLNLCLFDLQQEVWKFLISFICEEYSLLIFIVTQTYLPISKLQKVVSLYFSCLLRYNFVAQLQGRKKGRLQIIGIFRQSLEFSSWNTKQITSGRVTHIQLQLFTLQSVYASISLPFDFWYFTN